MTATSQPGDGETSTHVVTNQPPPLAGHDVFGTDLALVEAVERHAGGSGETKELHSLGVLAGTEQAQRWGAEANESVPRLRTHDRFGVRVDEVEFHPSWHRLLEVATAHGLHAAPWTDPAPAPHLRRAAGFMVWSQVEAGHGCPVSMTYAAVPALRRDPDVAADWVPGLAERAYQPGLRAPATKAGLLAGMGMTEKQGGSDVRANTTTAAPTSEPGTYLLRGHKWFCSAPMSDVFLVLAQAPGGLTCFVVPRVLPDGTRNPWALQRLKDKLGNRSNASAEVELDGTVGRRLGDEGRGVATIIEMVATTRLDCVLGSAALMRAAVAQATHHATHRRAFGDLLVDKPLMRAVLADLAVESEAATALAMRLAAAFDGGADPHEAALRRLAVPAAKFWVCKRAVALTAEALECLGGNGYVEESGMPRLLREAPVNSVWEGSGNVTALDVVRAATREPHAAEAVLAEVRAARGGDAALDRAAGRLEVMLLEGVAEQDARALAVAVAVTLQGALLVRFAPAPVADLFCATRLGGDERPWLPASGWVAGGAGAGGARAATAVVARATPVIG